MALNTITTKIGGRQHTRNVACRWVYFCNTLLLLLNIAVLVTGIIELNQHYMQFFNINASKFEVLWLFIGTGILIITCFVGCCATTIAHKPALRIYFILLCITAITDVLIGLVWMFKLHRMHYQYNEHLYNQVLIAQEKGDENFCSMWRSMETDLGCCGIILENGTKTMCDSNCQPVEPTPDCSSSLLEFLHKSTDTLFIIGYCFQFLIKLFFIIILRKEIRNMIDQINYLHQQKTHFIHAIVMNSMTNPAHDYQNHNNYKPSHELESIDSRYQSGHNTPMPNRISTISAGQTTINDYIRQTPIRKHDEIRRDFLDQPRKSIMELKHVFQPHIEAETEIDMEEIVNEIEKQELENKQNENDSD